MPSSWACPKCGKVYKLPDNVAPGRKVQCKACGAVGRTAGAPVAAAPASAPGSAPAARAAPGARPPAGTVPPAALGAAAPPRSAAPDSGLGRTGSSRRLEPRREPPRQAAADHDADPYDLMPVETERPGSSGRIPAAPEKPPIDVGAYTRVVDATVHVDTDLNASLPLTAGVLILATILIPWLLPPEGPKWSWDLLREGGRPAVGVVGAWIVAVGILIAGIATRGLVRSTALTALAVVGLVLLLVAATGGPLRPARADTADARPLLFLLAALGVVATVIVAGAHWRLGNLLPLRIVALAVAGLTTLLLGFLSIQALGQVAEAHRAASTLALPLGGSALTLAAFLLLHLGPLAGCALAVLAGALPRGAAVARAPAPVIGGSVGLAWLLLLIAVANQGGKPIIPALVNASFLIGGMLTVLAAAGAATIAQAVQAAAASKR